MSKRKKLIGKYAWKEGVYGLPSEPAEFFELITSKIKELESAGWENLHISFDDETRYGDSLAYIVLVGDRLETLEEMRQRLTDARTLSKRKEEQERATYERLKKQFEG